MSETNCEWIDPSKKKKSAAWQHFLEEKTDKKKLKCRHCEKILVNNGSTTTLLNHVTSVHGIDIAKDENMSASTSASGTTKDGGGQRTIGDFFSSQNRDSIELVLSRMVAKDLVPMNTIVTSQDIQRMLKSDGYSPPKSLVLVRKLIASYSHKIRDEVRRKLQRFRQDGVRLSLSFDEYTSLQNARFVCLNIHAGPGIHVGLGMIRLKDSATAENLKEAIKKKLNEFDLSLDKDIFAAVTDGASVMKKCVKDMGLVHQECFSHSLHLAITDAIYKGEALTPSRNIDDDSLEDSDAEEEEEDDKFEEEDEEEEFNGDYGAIIRKVRRISKFFRMSGKRNDKLQEFVKNEKGKQLKLLLDTPTRWGSLHKMISRFLQINTSVRQALAHFDKQELYLSRDQLTQLSKLVTTLETVDAASVSLGRGDGTLASAEKIFSFLLHNLEQQSSNEGSSPLAAKIYSLVKERIEHRRIIDLAGLCCYLRDPSYFDSSHVLPTPTKAAVTNLARDIFTKFHLHSETAPSEDGEEDKQDEEPSAKKSKYEELALILNNPVDPANQRRLKNQSSSRQLIESIKKEMKAWESTGKLLDTLESVKTTIESLPPSSTEAERQFSAAGLFLTKLRCRLSDNSIDMLCFLRAYFLSLEK